MVLGSFGVYVGTRWRSASYFQIEARGDVRQAGSVPRETGPTGYDRIGLALMKALVGNGPVKMVVKTRNRRPAVP